MEDIVERLRHWTHGLTYDPAAGLMHEAAAEIQRLRNGAAASRETVRLADEERAAVEWCVRAATNSWYGPTVAATLRNMLERLHT